MALKRHIKENPLVTTTVPIAVPEDGSVLSGQLDVKYRFVSEAKLDEMTEKVAKGELTPRQQFLELIPYVAGLPGADGNPVPADDFYDWFEQDDFGQVVRTAVMADYMSWVGGARAKNSQRSRTR